MILRIFRKFAFPGWNPRPSPETMKSLRNIDGLGGHFAPKRIFREKSGISLIFIKFHENCEFSWKIIIFWKLEEFNIFWRWSGPQMLNSANLHENHEFSWKFTIFMKFHENGRNSWFSRKCVLGQNDLPNHQYSLVISWFRARGADSTLEMQIFWKSAKSRFLKIPSISWF